MNLSHTRAHRASVARELRNLLDNNPGKLWTGDHQKVYDAKLADIERLDDRIALADPLSERAITDTYLRKGEGGFTDAQRLKIVNTMGVTVGSQGGFTVSSEVAARLVDVLKDYSGIRRVAEVIVTERGNPLPFPNSDGTTETAELVAENATATNADPTFGSVAMTTYRYSSKVFTVPIELLQDSSIDIEAFVFQRAASRIGRLSNTHFTTGTGGGQPQGVVGAATVGKTGTTGQTTTVIHDDLVDLIHSVNAAYRIDPVANEAGAVGFMLSDATFKVCRKLKDSQARPIYLPDDMGPESLLGYPVNINDDVPAMAANARSILFGNFRAYKVRDALDVQIYRMSDSAYTIKGQVGFLAFIRSGGNLADAASVKTYVNSAT